MTRYILREIIFTEKRINRKYIRFIFHSLCIGITIIMFSLGRNFRRIIHWNRKCQCHSLHVQIHNRFCTSSTSSSRGFSYHSWICSIVCSSCFFVAFGAIYSWKSKIFYRCTTGSDTSCFRYVNELWFHGILVATAKNISNFTM